MSNTNTSDGQQAGIGGLAAGIWIALGIAAAAAAYLLHAFMQKSYGVEAFESICSFGAALDCDKINTSAHGKLLDFPLTVFAIPTYAALTALTWLGTSRTDQGRGAMRLVQVGAAGAVLYGLFLLYVMIAIEETFCLFCLTMDAMALVTLALSTLALRKLGPPEVKPAVNKPLVIALIVGGALFGVTSLWHDDTKKALVAQQIAKAEADIARSKAQAAEQAAKKPENTASATSNAASSAAGESTGKAEKLGDNLYKIPVHPEDPTYGPADAKVTVIEYADFQCAYCKKVFYNLKLLKDRYKAKVRFVFKHFPMNTLCNKHIKNNRHRYACNAALTAECARQQGKFWEVHDLMFKNQHRLEKVDRDFYAHSVGLDMGKYAECMADRGAPRKNLARSMEEAASIGITATPRTFINGQMLSGAISAEVLDHFITQELEKAGDKAPEGPVAKRAFPMQKPPDAPMLKVALANNRSVFIDVYEASVDAQGRALSVQNAIPANLNWYDAKKACEKAGKRLCTSEEWVSACAGKPAVDNDGDGNFANDYVEGTQFPYADYYEDGFCHVEADSRTGRPRVTGSSPQCRTPTGLYDLAGNVAEWVEHSDDKAFLIGGDFRAAEKASCVRANDSFGPGNRHFGIGFRCCADRLVDNATTKWVETTPPTSLVGEALPPLKGKLRDGSEWDSSSMKGKVTFLTFFASWCSPCRRELPELAKLVKEHGKDGFEVVAIGVDTEGEKARQFAAEVGVNFPVVVDPDALLLGKLDVQNMPTGYLVDRKLIIRNKQVGYGTQTLEELVPLIKKHLKK